MTVQRDGRRPFPHPLSLYKEVTRVGVDKYDPTVAFAGHRFAAVAVTDNGQEPPELVEVAVVTIDGGVAADTTTHWLIRPGRPISAPIIRAYGITNEHVAAAPALPEVAHEILAAVEGRILVAHRGRYCLDLLSAALPGWAPPSTLDMRRLSVRAWPTSSRALGELIRRANLTCSGSLGRADHDARATALLFLELIHRLRRSRTPAQLVQWATLPAEGPAW